MASDQSDQGVGDRSAESSTAEPNDLDDGPRMTARYLLSKMKTLAGLRLFAIKDQIVVELILVNVNDRALNRFFRGPKVSHEIFRLYTKFFFI